MRVEMTGLSIPTNEVRVGNVYPIQGGWGRRAGHVMVLLAITETKGRQEGGTALLMIIDKDGDPVDVTKYGTHALAERCPIAYVDGVDNAVLMMRSL